MRLADLRLALCRYMREKLCDESLEFIEAVDVFAILSDVRP